MNLLDKRPVKHPRTASRVIDGEAVIVIPEENIVKVLNDVGSQIWELADGTRTVGEIGALIYEEYKVSLEQAKQDTMEFVEELVKDGMMTFEEVQG